MTKDVIPVIKLHAVVKKYGRGDTEVRALDQIDLEVDQGEFIAIMGPSGCGKTTLLNIIGLLDLVDEGEYLLDDKNVEQMRRSQRARIRAKKIGIVFQNFNLIDRMNVIDNVALPLTYDGVHRTKRLLQASAVLKSFHLNEREYFLPGQLSGGQMQRVAIARALVNSPSLILADEPTGNLDSRSSHVIMEELAELHRAGNTILMVTHNPGLTSYASRVIHMLDGKIASDRKIRVISSSKPEVITLRRPKKTDPTTGKPTKKAEKQAKSTRKTKRKAKK